MSEVEKLPADSPASAPTEKIDITANLASGSDAAEAKSHLIIKTKEFQASTSSDVAVQATPAKVATELMNQPGILRVTHAMRSQGPDRIAGGPQHNKEMTNTKEKTPMCLINELARYNKVHHKYVLTDEQGPAHKKQFHVNLELGDELYSAWGMSIKRAQHAAAEEALTKTSYKKPVNKVARPNTPTKKAVMTPTVELNALAMKLGQAAEYAVINPGHRVAPVPYMYHPLYGHSGNFYPVLRPKISRNYCILLRVGKHEFKGEGATRQQARHNAASRALSVLKSLVPVAVPGDSPTEERKNHRPESDKQQGPSGPESNGATSGTETLSDEGDGIGNSAKSEISAVHELALQHNLLITFEVTHESGPPHLRKFITCCKCGDFLSQGEGGSKKLSKKHAAQTMLEQLRALSPVSSINKTPKQKTVVNKKKNRNLIKMQKANPDYGSGINPISRLIQIQQANKKREPQYTLISEQGLPRKREFTIQVSCNDKTCTGRGPNKKLAKRNAAEEMLQLLGYSKPSPSPGKSVLKGETSTSSSSKHVTFNMDTGQKVGALVKTESSLVTPPPDPKENTEASFDIKLAATIAEELLATGNSPSGCAHAPDIPLEGPLEQSRDKLEYLSKVMNFYLEYTDFPKGTNTNMCLTLVALHMNPAQVFHGSAPTTEESHNAASFKALEGLSAHLSASEQLTDGQSQWKEGEKSQITENKQTDQLETAGHNKQEVVQSKPAENTHPHAGNTLATSYANTSSDQVAKPASKELTELQSTESVSPLNSLGANKSSTDEVTSNTKPNDLQDT